MQTLKRLTLAIAGTLAVATLVAPVAAEPDDPMPDGDEPSFVAKHKKRSKKGKRPKFPMEAAKFRNHVEQRLSRVEARINRKLEEKNAPPEVKARIKAELAKNKALMRAAVLAASADGTVTKDEAQKIRALAKSFRKGRKGGKKGKRNKKSGQRNKRAERGNFTE